MPNPISTQFIALPSFLASRLGMRLPRTAARTALGCWLAVSCCHLPASQAATAEPVSIETALSSAAWSWGSEAEIRFNADGRGVTSEGTAFRWEIVRPQVIRMTALTSPTGSRTDHEALIVVDDHDERFTGTNFAGVETTGVRKAPAAAESPAAGEAPDQTIDALAPGVTQADATNALLAHSWSWAVDGAGADSNLEFQFLPTGIFLSSTGQEWSWKWVGAHRVMVQGGPGQIAYLNFDGRFVGFTTTGFNGGRLIRGARRMAIVAGARIATAPRVKVAAVSSIQAGKPAASRPAPGVQTAAAAPKRAPHPAPIGALDRRPPAAHAGHAAHGAPAPAPAPRRVIRR